MYVVNCSKQPLSLVLTESRKFLYFGGEIWSFTGLLPAPDTCQVSELEAWEGKALLELGGKRP